MTPAEYVAFRARELFSSPAAVTGRRLFQRLVKIRRTIATELRGEPFKLSLPEIGRALGGRHHSTVLWLLRGGRHK
jgi:chromosomal replication initiation ATPase DnaA